MLPMPSPRRAVEGVLVCFMVTSDRAQGNGMKLLWEKLRWDIRTRFFTQSMVGHWNKLLRKVVKAPRLTEFKELLDNTFEHMS